MELFILIGIVFVGWLMWSKNADKEIFLGSAWALMIGVGLVSFLWQIFSR